MLASRDTARYERAEFHADRPDLAPAAERFQDWNLLGIRRTYGGHPERALAENAPARRHARHHVVVDVAVQQPFAGRARHHVDRLHAAWQDFHHIGAVAL